MARNEALGKEPTIDEINAAEMATFKGFSTTDGEVSDGKQTAEETEALARQAEIEAAAKGDTPTAVAKEGEDDDEGGEQETPEEKAAREAAEAKLTDKQKAAKALQAKVGGKDAKHRSANDRIGQAVARQRAAERELAAEREARARDRGEFEARLSALEKGGLTPKEGATTVVDKDAPRPADYKYGELDAAYIRDLAVYETRKAIAEDRTKQTTAAQTDAQRREAQEFKAKADKFGAAGAEKFDDFNEVVVQGARDGSWPLSKTFGDLMFESEVGPDIAYYLATHVDEAVKIMEKSPSAQAAAFGRLEATFSSMSSDAPGQQEDGNEGKPGQAIQQPITKPAAGSTTKAPPPPQHKARGAGGKTQVSGSTNDFAAFERLAMGDGS